MNVPLGSPPQQYDARNEGAMRRSVEQAFAKVPDAGMAPYTVADLPAATGPYRWIFVTDESGGAVPAFNDGLAWRRCTDRAVVS